MSYRIGHDDVTSDLKGIPWDALTGNILGGVTEVSSRSTSVLLNQKASELMHTDDSQVAKLPETPRKCSLPPSPPDGAMCSSGDL